MNEQDGRLLSVVAACTGPSLPMISEHAFSARGYGMGSFASELPARVQELPVVLLPLIAAAAKSILDTGQSQSRNAMFPVQLAPPPPACTAPLRSLQATAVLLPVLRLGGGFQCATRVFQRACDRKCNLITLRGAEELVDGLDD